MAKPGPKQSPASLKLARLRAERLEKENERLADQMISRKELEAELAMMGREFRKILAPYPAELREPLLQHWEEAAKRVLTIRSQVKSLHRRNVGLGHG